MGGLTIEHAFGRCPIAQSIYSLFVDDQQHQEKVAFFIWTGIPPPHIPKQIWHYFCIITVYALDAGRRHIYQLQYHPQGKRKTTYDIVRKGKEHANQTFWRLVKMHCSVFPKPKDNCGPLPFVYWDADSMSWHPRAQ